MGLHHFSAVLIAALLATAPAHARTYLIDFVMNDSVLDPDGNVYDVGTPTPGGTIFDPANPVTPDVNVSGFIETDGTLGVLDASNIVAYRVEWTFDIHDEGFDQSTFDPSPSYIGSEQTVDVAGLFATETEIQITGAFELGGGYFFGLGLLPGFGGYSASFGWEGGDLILDQGGGFFSGSPYLSTGGAGFKATEAFPANSTLATAATVVPLPAGAVLMLGGLGVLAGMARRRARC